MSSRGCSRRTNRREPLFPVGRLEAHDGRVSDSHNLQRFVDAQDGIYETVLAELGRGSKQSHWMWFIFPQLRGLGLSPTAQHYGIASLEEARAYLEHHCSARACARASKPFCPGRAGLQPSRSSVRSMP